MTNSPKLKTTPAGMNIDSLTNAVRPPLTFVRICTGAVAAAFVLTACGGGGGTGSAGAATAPVSTAAPASASATSTAPAGTDLTTAAKTFTPSTAVPVTVFTPGTPNAPTVGGIVTDIKIQNTAAAQTSVPFTFGQVFAVGDLRPTEGLVAKLANGTILRLQTDVKATHADGSVRHAVISGVMPALATGETQTLQLAKSGGPETSALTPQNLIDAGLAGSVNVKVENVQYSASLTNALATATPIKWLSGSVANEWIVSVPLKAANGAVHPHLTARFDVRWYSGLSKQARVEFVVENNKTFAAGPQNFVYDVDLELGGKKVYSQANLTHYHHARWRNVAWWNNEPTVHLKHNTAYLIASKAVSNYDQSVIPAEAVLANYAKEMAGNTGPMKIGPLVAYMPTTGGRGDIGPLPVWSVMYLLSMDKRAKDMMMSAAEGSGTWSMHYRDEKTGYPVRVDNEVNKNISTHWNLRETGPLPVPRCGATTDALCGSPYADDTAHQPSLAYLPYLVTGDYYYLEELQFWAASNPLQTDPGYAGRGLGLLRWQQVRGQAWSMRTLGHAAYITPDSHALKGYFTKQLDNNLDFYHATYVVGNPNQLGAYDGSGEGAASVGTTSSPWQDDFFTWSFGYLAELGFTKAAPILQWKAKFPVGRMTAPGYCWIEASAYGLVFRDNAGRVFPTFAQVYAANFSNDWITDDGGRQIFHPLGLKYLDQPCGSQQQADWRAVSQGFEWQKGRMIGYADSREGYPANMQPALAVSATSGIPNASVAWSVFAARTIKPNYNYGPQWAIVPR